MSKFAIFINFLYISKMNVLYLKEFIAVYQHAVFFRLRAIFDSLEQDEIEVNDTLVIYKGRENGHTTYGKLFVELLGNSNLTEVIQILGNFGFITLSRVADSFVFFGRDHGHSMNIGVNLSNGKVILLDTTQSAYLYIADSESGFLDYLRIYLEYTLLPLELQKEKRITLSYRDKIIAAVGGEEYAHYYGFIFQDDAAPQTHWNAFPHPWEY